MFFIIKKFFGRDQSPKRQLAYITIQIAFLRVTFIIKKYCKNWRIMNIELTATKRTNQNYESFAHPSKLQDVSDKTKKYGKAISKRQKAKKRLNDWSTYQINIYARLILQMLIHNIHLGFNFTEVLMEKIKRTPKQIYAYHRKMLSQHRTNQQIIIHVLGSKLQRVKIKSMDSEILKNMQSQNQDISEKSFDEAEIDYLQKLMLTDSSPQEYQNDQDTISTQICDLSYSQYWQQQSIRWNSFQCVSSSEENISVQSEREDNMLLQCQSIV